VNYKNVEKWLALVELLRFSEHAIDEKPREFARIVLDCI
jgi:hypothetical protein